MKHVVDTIEALLAAAKAESGEPTRVFVISTYVIGKERILLAVRATRLCRVAGTPDLMQGPVGLKTTGCRAQ